MELPIYQENLRSSGDWRTGLEKVREEWATLAEKAITRIHEQQAQNLVNDVATNNFLVAAQQVSDWATDAAANLDVPRLLELNRTLTNNDTLFREVEATPMNEAHDPPRFRRRPAFAADVHVTFGSDA